LAAIFPALARTLRASSWQLVTISAEGTLRAVRTPCVFVGNNFYDLAVFGRRKDLSSGELCVYIVKQQTWLGLGLLPFKIAFGVSHREHDVELLRVQTLSLQSSRGDLLVATDGESAREIPPLVYRIRPKALRVLAPPASNLDPSGQRLMPATKASTGSKLP
jgi:diacylglycerol kinase family enzyme